MKSQVAALPLRRTQAGHIEVLLVTARRKQRWLIPKGNPSVRRSDADAAAREALEEAGVKGVLGRPVGRYVHCKGGRPSAKIKVFPLMVDGKAKRWPERKLRKRRWVCVDEVARFVKDPALAQLIATLAPTLSDIHEQLV